MESFVIGQKNTTNEKMKSLKNLIIESMSTEIQSRYFDDYDYEERKYIYKYTSNGIGKEVVVSLVESDDSSYKFQVNEEVVSIDRSVLNNCLDPDECGIEIAKQIINDNDGEVEMSLIDEYEGYLIDHLILTKELDFTPITEDDLTWTFSLYANVGMSVNQYEVYSIDEEDYDSVLSMMESEDTDELSNYLYEQGPIEYYELINLWGDDDREKLSYEVNDTDGDEVDSGELTVYERNVYEYPERGGYKLDKDPEKYLLVRRDEVKRSYCEFEVPKDFNVNNIRFINSNPFGNSMILDDSFGDTITNMTSFRYNGHFFDECEISDVGTWGDVHYSLYRWNEEKRFYELVVGF